MLNKLYIAVASAALLVGCAATVPMATTAEEAKAKQFVANANTAGVYIYRNESLGKAVKLPVELDGKVLGQTGYNTFFYTEVVPGTHKVTTRAENTTEVSFNAIAGKLYYIWQEVKMGIFAPRSELKLVDEATGQKAVKETNMAKPVQ